jgi:hypothetical protein
MVSEFFNAKMKYYGCSIITCVILTIGFAITLGLYIIPAFLDYQQVSCVVTDCKLSTCSKQVCTGSKVKHCHTEYVSCLKMTVELQIDPPERWTFERYGTCPPNGTVKKCYYEKNNKRETISLDDTFPVNAVIAICIFGFFWLISVIFMICMFCMHGCVCREKPVSDFSHGIVV